MNEDHWQGVAAGNPRLFPAPANHLCEARECRLPRKLYPTAFSRSNFPAWPIDEPLEIGLGGRYSLVQSFLPDCPAPFLEVIMRKAVKPLVFGIVLTMGCVLLAQAAD